jgi:membrane protease YdiL (CAAX protease family)
VQKVLKYGSQKVKNNMDRPLILFFIMTLVISWPLWYFSGVLTKGYIFSYDTQWLMAQIGVFAPSLSALILSSFQTKGLRRNALRIIFIFILIFIVGIVITWFAPRSIQDFTPTISIVVVMIGLVSILFFSSLNRRLLLPATGETQGKVGIKWVLLAIIGIPFLFLIGWIIINLYGNSWNVSSLKNGPTGFMATLFTVFFMNMIFGGSIGEELGWRGFALPLLLKKMTPLQASFILGLFTAFWHLPVDLSNDILSVIGAVVLRIAWSIPLAIIFTWLYLNSDGKLLIAILLHTAINVLPDLGFSQYKYSVLFLTIPLIITALVVSHTQRMKNQETSQDDQQI